MQLFEVLVTTKDDWIDIQGVSDEELSKALQIWSSGREETVTLNSFGFQSKNIKKITIMK